MVSLSERSTSFAIAPSGLTRGFQPRVHRRGPVVLATNGRSRNGAAVATAQQLAGQLDVPLEVVCVLEPAAAEASVADRLGSSSVPVDEIRRYAAETAASDYVVRFGGGATPPRVHVRCGAVATEISRFALEVSATVIVMGAPPGSTEGAPSSDAAAQVGHSAHCPVVTVRYSGDV